MANNKIMQIFCCDDIRMLPEAILKVVLGVKEQRDAIYQQLLEAHRYDMSYDWFQSLYEEELSQRKKMKQDFTPNSVGVLASMIANNHKGSVHEPTAGNGSMLIADWWQRCKRLFPWEHFPSEHMVDCWELSDRSIPILLLNLSIRGMMGYVTHGDVLENEIKQRYILLNSKDDTLAFSDVYKATCCDRLVRVQND